MDYVISTCSAADITYEHLIEKDVSYVPFSCYLNDAEMKDDLGGSISFGEFYEIMRQGANTRTSQPNREEYKAHFRKFLEDGRDVIHISLSSGISGAYDTCYQASRELLTEFPNRKIYVVDSLCASSGMGLLVDKIASLKSEGMSIEQSYDWAENNKLRIQHWFFTTDLSYFIKGGRVSKISGWIGTALKLCPLLSVDEYGKLFPKEKVRGKDGVIRKIVEKMEENTIDGALYDGACYISHADCYEDAYYVKELIESRFPNLKEPVKINNIGTTIGSHTGPGTVALFFFGKKRGGEE